MKIKTTLILWVIVFAVTLCTSRNASAQYCSPSFLNGCFSWENQAITLDAINWTIGSTTCSDFDYTLDTAHLDVGVPYPMTVMNGDWCGCGVWIDFNNDMAFDSTENLFHLYTANATNNYSFNITVPVSVPTGIYRMRVIAAWGSDTYTASANGYGPCGSFQYGNIDDFMVSVTNLSTGMEGISSTGFAIEVSPNPVIDEMRVRIPLLNLPGGGSITIKIFNSLGEKVIKKHFPTRQQCVLTQEPCREAFISLCLLMRQAIK